MTDGKSIIMGAKTFESIGKALPDRKNIILSDDPDYSAPDCIVVGSIDDALKEVKDDEEVMIVGGASVYEQFLPMANRLYLTFIHHDFKGDTLFPDVDFDQWQEIKREDHEIDDKNHYSYSFVIYQRK